MIRELQNENDTLQLANYFKYTNNCGDSKNLEICFDTKFKDLNG